MGLSEDKNEQNIAVSCDGEQAKCDQGEGAYSQKTKEERKAFRKESGQLKVGAVIRNFFYNIKAGIYKAIHKNRVEKSTNKKVKMLNRRRKEQIFLFFLLLFPIAHFIVFYVIVNFNSITLAFKQYDFATNGYIWLGFGNFSKFLSEFVTNPLMKISMINALTLYLVGLVISTPLTLLISYCLFKKVIGTEFFRVILFLPSIISGMVFVLIYRYIIEAAIPKIAEMFGVMNMPSLLIDPRYAFGTLIVYGLWTGFGMGTLLYSSAMTRISDSLIEYGRLEGIKPLREFWSIVLPLIFPTITTFLVTGVTGLFMGSGAVFAFFREDAGAHLYTFGYLLFTKVIGSKASVVEYPYASAAGLIFTLVTAPITLFVKYMLEKFGPTVEY